ncbi:MAG: M48 family metallopeptidase [Candidatus Marinimicrobia bacterium]|nr:M48 family metallopeptidase [Candidatus Neomarinimicrobiota bacterium]
MKNSKFFFSAIIISLLLVACSTMPLTGRRQISLIPTSTMLSMSFQQYKTFLDSNQVIASGKEAAMVQRVGQKLAGAAENYLTDKKLGDEIKNFDWEFKLVKSDEVNAWCMPGGKIVVYSGILPLTQTEAGLAVVIGHEIGHALAHHGNERMSQGLMTQLGGVALSVALQEKPAQTQQIWMAAFGLGAQFGMLLPYSRLHEYEADQFGLTLMTMAGYEPQESVTFWERMSKLGGAKPPEFASTHPADEKRVAQLKKLLPKMEKFKPQNSTVTKKEEERKK